MTGRPAHDTPSDPPTTGVLAELARRLRDADHFDPDARAEAARLLDELAAAVDEPGPSPHTEELARRAADLVHAIQDAHRPGLVEAARERMEQTVARAEATTPATDIVLRLIDVLAGLGI